MDIQNQNPASLAGQNGVEYSIGLTNEQGDYTMNGTQYVLEQPYGGNKKTSTAPAQLSAAQINEIEKSLSPSAHGAIRFIRKIANKPKSDTQHLWRKVPCKNPAEIAHYLRSKLAAKGLEVRVTPPSGITSKLFDASKMEWALYPLVDESNVYLEVA